MDAYPIKLSYHVRDYYFGERLIPEMLGKSDAPEGVVAETWEISDYRETTGTVANGPYAGRTLHELVEEFPDELVGEGWRGPHFPLLIKFLDASTCCPSTCTPTTRPRGRNTASPTARAEAWHILWAADGATILAGIEEDLSREELVEAFKAQDYDAVMPRHGIRPGDTVYVPGGILHTFGPDTLILEVQQTSDLGQFVMPFDLYGNRLDEEEWDANIEATLDELKTDYLPRPNPGLVLEDGRQQARPVLRRPALRPGTLDAHGDLHRTFAPASASSRSRTSAQGRGAGVRGRFRDARTRRELRLASRHRRGEGGPRRPGRPAWWRATSPTSNATS